MVASVWVTDAVHLFIDDEVCFVNANAMPFLTAANAMAYVSFVEWVEGNLLGSNDVVTAGAVVGIIDGSSVGFPLGD